MNNDNFFDIWQQLSSKEECKAQESEKLSYKVIVSLNEDSNGEPYIGINYIDKNGNEIGLENFDNLEKLDEFSSVVKSYFDTALPVMRSNTIISILYNLCTKNINLVKMENASYKEKYMHYDRNNSALLGYIVDKNVDLDYELKVKILYSIIKKLMDLAYYHGGEEDIIFKIKNNIIMNIYYRRNRNFPLKKSELYEQIDSAIVESEFKINLNESYQKNNIKE